ncbi:DNA-binding protein [Vibrio alginolyticus]
MKEFDFALVAKFQGELNADMLCALSNALFEAGANDCTVSASGSDVRIEFDREADSYGEAVQIAIQQVNQVSGLIVLRVTNNESDHAISQLKEFEPSDYLTDQQTTQAYLDEAASTGEPELIAEALATIAKAKGMDNTLQPSNNPSLSSLISLANVLGVSVKLGINGE